MFCEWDHGTTEGKGKLSSFRRFYPQPLLSAPELRGFELSILRSTQETTAFILCMSTQYLLKAAETLSFCKLFRRDRMPIADDSSFRIRRDFKKKTFTSYCKRSRRGKCDCSISTTRRVFRGKVLDWLF